MSKDLLDACVKAAERSEQLKTAGRERLKAIIPASAKAIIAAELRKDESDPMTDYSGYRTERTVILGFSTHTKDLFSELRRHAANFPETIHLSEGNRKYEHREKYAGGEGYYLGENGYSGWIIKKEKLYGTREQCIERYSLTAGDEANICVKAAIIPGTAAGNFTIVDYSEKALAVFGDTRAVKEQLKALGGRFNPQLTHEGEKQSGWIFSKGMESALRNFLAGNVINQKSQIHNWLTPILTNS